MLLAAPTGRAAKRMSETTGLEAKTIHRLLEYSRQKGGFQRDRDKPLVEVVVFSGLVPSKGQARREIEAGGIYLNDKQEKNPNRIVTAADYLLDQHLKDWAV